ncbi:MAG: alpha/beta hydrolase [Vicingus serpentipes]|nr:alpha/beta hydrolase [Vicingus serpentipes]
MRNLVLFLVLFSSFRLIAQEKITFNATDGLEVTADLYITHPNSSPLIILFHQAGWSRGEYLEIAPKLNELGYNCIAVDQRSGGEINGVLNETNQRALEQEKGTSYVDALVDMISAIDYVKSNYKDAQKIILWGSSYSSSLALKIAGERTDIDAVISFAPGEYFKSLGEPSDYIQQSAQNILVPVFITSMKTEKKNWWSIYEAIPSIGKDYFLPDTEGQHGSRALWEKFPEHENYWKAVTAFLKTI